MKEIKFRGKSVNDGEWIYGSLVIDGHNYYILEKIETVNEYGDGTDFYATSWGEIIAETVGQYVELKDKNGVNIYEGDIVRADGEYGDGLTGEIYYKNGCFMLQYHALYQIYNAEVIGTIYDNPNILQ